MDTVEWGTVDAPPGPIRGGGRGALTAPIVGAVGFALLLASAVLPWASAPATANQNGAGNATGVSSLAAGGTQSVGLDGLASIPAFAYDISMILFLGVAGALLAARPMQRRALFGAGVGLAGAQLMLLLMLTRELQRGAIDGLTVDGSVASGSVTLGAGLYLAYLGMVVILAAVVIGGAPLALLRRLARDPEGEVAPRRSRRRSRYEEPRAPVDLTVEALEPIDESYFVQPDEK